MTEIDNKKLCAVSMRTNHLNETFIFGQLGKTSKASTVVTLQYVKPEMDGDMLLKFWEKRIGRPFREIECIQEGIDQQKELEELAFVAAQ